MDSVVSFEEPRETLQTWHILSELLDQSLRLIFGWLRIKVQDENIRRTECILAFRICSYFVGVIIDLFL